MENRRLSFGSLGHGLFFFFLMVFGLLLGSAGIRSLSAATFCVDDASDGAANAADCAETCDGSDDCSLRDALTANNANDNNPAVDDIIFNIPGAGPHIIQPNNQLPTIAEPVTVDGYTEPGSSPNTLVQGNNAIFKIILDGSLADPPLMNEGVNGIEVTGGPATIRGLVIHSFQHALNGSDGHGIVLFNVAGNTNNLIEGNFIGTEGALEVGNEGAGIVIFLQSTDNTIGGATPAARNVISGNGRQGISLNSSSNTVQGNYIGTDRTGTIAIPNGFQGVAFFGSVSASGNVVGGVNPGEGNLISGNNLSGVALVENVSDTQILGNFIGTDVTGTVDLGNVQHGVLLDDGIFGAPSGNFIGGDAGTTPGGPCTGACNLISGNGMDGVHLEGVGTDGNTVQGNLITFNETGVFVVDGIDNAILANSIFSNNQLGIDLQTIGIDPNDSGDGDTGGNNLQNFPELSSALSANGNLTIDGTLNSSPDTTYLLEFFANDACDPSGNGEGQTFLGSADVTTDGSGSAAIQADLPAPAAAGPVLTATATDPAGNTSEFSNCVTVVLGETCDNGVDDDGDGFQDCDDSECADFATCLGNGTADGGGCSLQGGLKSRSYPFLLLGMLLASMGFMLRRVSR